MNEVITAEQKQQIAKTISTTQIYLFVTSKLNTILQFETVWWKEKVFRFGIYYNLLLIKI